MLDPLENWRKSSLYDFKVARDMFSKTHYGYVFFFCHMAIEKMLKASVEKITGKTPPKTHNLRLLLKQSKLEAPDNTQVFIGELSEASIPTRYPLDIEAAAESYTKSAAEKCLKKTEKVVKWIESFLKR